MNQPPAAQTPAADLSRILREARERKGTSVAQAEASTRVRQKYLRAMEEGDWTALPEALYTRGFIRSYARYLGLDPDAMLTLYQRAQATPKATANVRPAMSPLRLTASTWTGIVVGLLVFAIFAAGLFYLYNQYMAATPSPTPIAIPDVPTAVPTPTPTVPPLVEVTMPDLVGQDLSAAEVNLKGLGLTVTVGDRRYDTKILAGRVITQSVLAGQRVRQGQAVSVVLSRGREGLSVPNVVNIGFEQARNILISAGFTVQRQDVAGTQAAAGTVIRQEPAPSSAAVAGSAVVVYVSQAAGPSTAGKIVVPNVVGKPWTEARKILLDAGLTIRGVQLQDATYVPGGYVLSTLPAAGTLVDPGSGIDVGVRRE